MSSLSNESNRLIIICHNKCFGESLAFSLNSIFGYQDYVLHNASKNLFQQLRDIEIQGSIIFIEDDIPGLNYPFLIDEINRYEPELLLLIGNTLESIISTIKLQQLGCDIILNKKIGLKGIVNSLISWRLKENPLNKSLDPFSRLNEIDNNFLKDIYYLTPGQIKQKHGVSQQRIWTRKEKLFSKLTLNPHDSAGSFRALYHLYKF